MFEERNEAMCRLREQGMTYVAIGRMFNVSKQRVEQVVKHRIMVSGGKKTMEKRIRRRHGLGWSVGKLAAHYHKSPLEVFEIVNGNVSS